MRKFLFRAGAYLSLFFLLLIAVMLVKPGSLPPLSKQHPSEGRDLDVRLGGPTANKGYQHSGGAPISPEASSQHPRNSKTNSSEPHIVDELYRTNANAKKIWAMVGQGLVSAVTARFLLGEEVQNEASDAVSVEILAIASNPAMPTLLRRYAIAGLSQDQRDFAVSILLGLATQTDTDERLKSGALWALRSRIKERQDVATVFQQALISENAEVQFAALYNFGRSGVAISLPTLLGLVSDAASTFISVEAVAILGEQMGPEAIPHLRQFAADASGVLPLVRERSKDVLESLLTRGAYAREQDNSLAITRRTTTNGVTTEEVLYPIAVPPKSGGK